MLTSEKIAKWSNGEKVAAMQLLWNDFSSQDLASDVPSRHKAILDKREEAVKSGSSSFISWEDAKSQIDESCR